jgi:hypothetical protein
MRSRERAGFAGATLAALWALTLSAASCGGRSNQGEGPGSPEKDGGSVTSEGGSTTTTAVDGASAGVDGIAPGADGGGGADATTVPDPAGTSPPTIGGDGYLTLDAGAYVLVGYVSSSVGGSSSSISLTYGPTSFCASGVVAQNDTYNSWAAAGFNVDQTQASQATAKTLLLSASSITVAFSNQAGSPLLLQLLDQGYNYWCYPLSGATSPVTIPLSSFNSACWDNSGQAFTPGTSILAINLDVPGSNSASTPYSFCFYGMTIQPLADAGVADAGVADATVVDAGVVDAADVEGGVVNRDF